MAGTGIKFPFVIKDANVYIEGAELLGKAEIELPEVSHRMVDYEAMGVAGKIELPITGHVEQMKAKLKFHVLVADVAARIFDTSKAQMIDARASYQQYDPKSGNMEEKPIKVIMRGFFAKVPLGTWKPGEGNKSDIEISALYLKVTIDGQDVVEVDPANYIYMVNGNDLLATTRANIGMA